MYHRILIAVVLDAYESAKDKTTDEAMWLSRLEFATEVVVLKNIWLNHAANTVHNKCRGCLSDIWKCLILNFQDAVRLLLGYYCWLSAAS